MKLDQSDKQFLREYKNKLLTELAVAYMEARKNGKRKTMDEQRFETAEVENLVELTDELYDKTYKPSRGIAHVIRNPVIREIFAAKFRDRVVHHWVYDKIYDWWDRHFIFDAYSCRKGKGILKGIKRLDMMVRRASKNYTEEVFIVKMDIKAYFVNIDRKILYKRVMWGVDKQYEDRKDSKEYEILKYVIREIIFDDPVKGAIRKGWPEAWRKLPKSKSLIYQTKGVGIVIGNLTSQLFSNILLDELDRYIKFTLGYKYYGRYVDDFFIVLNAKQLDQFKRDKKAIEEEVKRLGLTLHPNKFSIQKMERGAQFIGGVIYPRHTQPSERMKKKFRLAMKEYVNGKKSVDSIISYMGHVKHFSHVKFNEEIYGIAGWEYREKMGYKNN